MPATGCPSFAESSMLDLQGKSIAAEAAPTATVQCMRAAPALSSTSRSRIASASGASGETCR